MPTLTSVVQAFGREIKGVVGWKQLMRIAKQHGIAFVRFENGASGALQVLHINYGVREIDGSIFLAEEGPLQWSWHGETSEIKAKPGDWVTFWQDTEGRHLKVFLNGVLKQTIKRIETCS